jgi:hypothetical protein
MPNVDQNGDFMVFSERNPGHFLNVVDNLFKRIIRLQNYINRLSTFKECSG